MRLSSFPRFSGSTLKRNEIANRLTASKPRTKDVEVFKATPGSTAAHMVHASNKTIADSKSKKSLFKNLALVGLGVAVAGAMMASGGGLLVLAGSAFASGSIVESVKADLTQRNASNLKAQVMELAGHDQKPTQVEPGLYASSGGSQAPQTLALLT